MTHLPSTPLHAEIDAELAHVAASEDLAENDEPERTPYETRLHNLHDAVVAVEGAATQGP